MVRELVVKLQEYTSWYFRWGLPDILYFLTLKNTHCHFLKTFLCEEYFVKILSNSDCQFSFDKIK